MAYDSCFWQLGTDTVFGISFLNSAVRSYMRTTNIFSSPVGCCTENFEFLVCSKAKFIVEHHFFGCGDRAMTVYSASAWYSDDLLFRLQAREIGMLTTSRHASLLFLVLMHYVLAML